MPVPVGGDQSPMDDAGVRPEGDFGEPLEYDEDFWPKFPEPPPIHSLPNAEYEALLSAAVKGLREVGHPDNEAYAFGARFLGQALNHLDKAQHALANGDEMAAMAHLSFADVHLRHVAAPSPHEQRIQHPPSLEEGRRAVVCQEGMRELLDLVLEWTLDELALHPISASSRPNLAGNLRLLYEAAQFAQEEHRLFKAEKVRQRAEEDRLSE